MAKPTGPGSINLQMYRGAISMDVAGFDAAVANHGIQLVHYRGMRCPIGLTERHDSRQPHHTHSNCSNGFMYRKAGKLTALFYSNSTGGSVEELGVEDGSTVVATLPRCYDDTEDEILVAPFDKFYLDDEKLLVVNWQLVESHITGIDRLQYPAVEVEAVVDANGEEYSEGKDFSVTGDGAIKWLTANRPEYNPVLGKGCVYVIRYRYRPYWYCKQLLHEIRLVKVSTSVGRETKRMNFQAVFQRETVFAIERRDDEGKDDISDTESNESGSFGPR